MFVRRSPSPMLLEVGVHQQETRELALGPRGRLEADRVEARHLAQDPLEVPLELERTLRRVVVGERVQVAEAAKADQPLVDPRVVLHRAGAEGVEAGVDAEVPGRELREVAEHLGLGDLGEPRR